jgi:fungal type III polyketide synthase
LFNSTPALEKTLRIVETSGVAKRGLLFGRGHPIFETKVSPTFDELRAAYRERAVPMAAQAAYSALRDAGLTAYDVTHLVCTTVGNLSNPGCDVELLEELGIANNGVERYLLSGVGCAGGLACVRAAANVLLASQVVGRPAKVLVVAFEIPSPLYNHWAQRVNDTQKVDVGLAVFTDGASALVMSCGDTAPSSPCSDLDTTGGTRGAGGAYELRAFTSWTQAGTVDLLRGDFNSSGWGTVVSPQVPVVTISMVAPTFELLLQAAGLSHLKPEDCDWAVHPGGAAILRACAKSMSLVNEDHLRASWAAYSQHGNTSSAAVLSVMSAIRGGRHAVDVLGKGVASNVEVANPREWLIAVAFGIGVTIEMMVFRNTGFLHGRC